MNLQFWLAILALGIGSYWSAVYLALLTVSRSGLEARLQPTGKAHLAEWFFNHERGAVHVTAFLRAAARVTLFIVIIVEVCGVGDLATITISRLLIAAGLSLGLSWLFTTVVAGALARHAGLVLVASALPWVRVATIAFTPVEPVLGVLDEAVRRLTGANLREAEGLEADLLRSIEDTQREGGLDEQSATLLENVVEFSSTDVGEVMTPRTDIDGIEANMSLSDIRTFFSEAGHSRIPVYEGNLDHIVGVLYVKDLVRYLGENLEAFDLRTLLRQPIVVPETRAVRDLLADFQRSEVHMAIVVDEYGGTAGLVTIEDVLEEIVGEIHDEHDADDDELPDLVRLDQHRAEVDGRFHIDDLNEKLGLNLPEDMEFDTIGGFVLSEMGRVPEVGECLETASARFTALKATPTAVHRLRVELMNGSSQDSDVEQL